MSRLAVAVAATVGAALLAACGGDPGKDRSGDPAALGPQPSEPQPSTVTARPVAPTPDGQVRPRVTGTVATGLEVPWGVTFLPDGSALVGERDSTRVLSIPAGGGAPREVGRVEVAAPRGEAGLLGLAASPSYAEDRTVFAYVSTESDNRVVRFTVRDGRMGSVEPVLTGIPNGFIHDGGRLLFATDGTLFVSTGETGVPELAQDVGSLGGKILHITPDGRPAPDNPRRGSPVWTMGHRNVQGLAYDDQGRLWATEFGQQTWDELNLVEKGRNYGWPVYEGRGEGPGSEDYRDPFVTWRTDDASPSGLAYLDGSLWAGALKGERLWQVPVTTDGVGRPRGWFVGDHGRLRTVTAAPDGTLWVTTSNRDGRGAPRRGDDRVLQVTLR
ncbi:PQQ-dependent sugar dehydrogenase [Nocardioides marmoribigeumensis]|uniref:Glucose/arabinose dehydrogenase n=1 Tax=Nocardioides marmoribigeumensis TaxID=433649 RepID=A0ABU2BW39_9ACTN|nr:PQQ-dependent sugar dehydrogenase [Nocardioides marmoribigeumensis]MDR7361564.1 glucose/arabinose dehydrogenase [Nocardioides marmoribigeumensis]